MNILSSITHRLSSKKGFTLIELLVVIAIIGIILLAVTANFLTAQKQARNARRKQDMEAIQTAMESYFVIHNSVYPTTPTEYADAFDSAALPKDPQPSKVYHWNTVVDKYCICADLEDQNGNSNSNNSTTCSWTDTGQYYCVANRQ